MFADQHPRPFTHHGPVGDADRRAGEEGAEAHEAV